MKELMLEAGCSSLTWESKDQKHLWGRNFDFNRIAQGTGITYVPKGLEYYTIGSELEHNLAKENQTTAQLAAMGMGSFIMKPTPVLYEGINEAGLMGGQLYYRQLACYETQNPHHFKEIQPAYVVTYILTHCHTVKEIQSLFQSEIIIKKVGIFGKIPDIHWFFCDAQGQSIVIEMDSSGLHLITDNLGVLTNSPNYDWHRHHLKEYANLQPMDIMHQSLNGQSLAPCYSGTGMTGLPGDWSSPSRFVRLALLREYAQKGDNETIAVARMFRLLQNVAFPLGLVQVGDLTDIGQHDTDFVPYDYTLYSAVMCAESKTYYWYTYDDLTIHSITLDDFVPNTTCQVKLLSF